MHAASVTEETIVLPTYPVGEPEKNPLFLENRVYQGSSGAVYPYPVVESVGLEKSDRGWKALILENEYVKVTILPELGGRVYAALDKTNNYDFVYRNGVVKPALVGLAGPWISGGIEFNWPQHHRPSTYEATDYDLVTREDGSASVIIGELEKMTRSRCTMFFTLTPGRAALEIEVRLFNGSRKPVPFLWWANPAVSVGEHYQSIFPPDVHAVMDHGKRDVSTFPVATGTYYKVDYSSGVDISRYANIPVPTSYMAYHSDYDFIGCYDHGKGAGMLHVANHHLVPGKKQWTWGNGEFGAAWDRNLTDDSGPYIELMTGAFTDNQPDFSWLQPDEEKVFAHTFMPYKGLGEVANASNRGALKLSVTAEEVTIGLYCTGAESDLRLRLLADRDCVFERSVSVDPRQPFVERIQRNPSVVESAYRLELIDGEEIILWADGPQESTDPLPKAARAPLPPRDIRSVEELYLAGLHLEQYRHATRNPEDYYGEALNRDPGESRCLTAMGRRRLARADFEAAEDCFRRAIDRLTMRNPNPYDGEALFHLGWSLRYRGKDTPAYEQFYKSVWNAAWQGPGYTELARISCGMGLWDRALEEVDRALAAGSHNRTALLLKSIILRRAGRVATAGRALDDLEAVDPLYHGIGFERYLLAGDRSDAERALSAFRRIIGGRDFSWIELCLEYFWCGQYEEALRLLELSGTTASSPLALYYAGYLWGRRGDVAEAERSYDRARAADPTLCFVSRIESAMILESVVDTHREDARARYLLGNFYYAAGRYERALELWERSAALDTTFPTTRRNLALGYFNHTDHPERARACLEEAFRLDRGDARVLYELDQLYKKQGLAEDYRLRFLEENREVVEKRDDLVLERISLLNRLDRPEEAYRDISQRRFRPWEGGEGRVAAEYVRSLVLSAYRSLTAGRCEEAETLLKRAYTYPDNLGEGKLSTMTDNELDFLMGVTLHRQGRVDAAREYWQSATRGDSRPAVAVYYNDQSPELIFYQGLALRQLGRHDESRGRFHSLVSWARAHYYDEPEIDYFAVSLPDLLIFNENDPRGRHRRDCTFLRALGEYGLGRFAVAEELLDRIAAEDRYAAGVAGIQKLIRLNLNEVRPPRPGDESEIRP